jgi:REP element-mobilizing transposase RayT
VAYLDRIEHYRERYRCILYAYVLMSNHVHLPIETGAVGLSKIMQGIQFSYTQRYNRRYRVVGHLFQGRYIKARVVAEHLNRDPSMISRLHAEYMENVIGTWNRSCGVG